MEKSKREQKPPSILIVDDEHNVALTLRLVFEDIGYAVTIANSCAAALGIVQDGRRTFDAVITDLSMEEDQSGLKLATVAARLHPRPSVVMITGFGTLENVQAAVGSVVDHFALKPLDLEELKRVVALLIALRRDRLD